MVVINDTIDNLIEGDERNDLHRVPVEEEVLDDADILANDPARFEAIIADVRSELPDDPLPVTDFVALAQKEEVHDISGRTLKDYKRYV